MHEDAPDAGDTEAVPARRKRAVARAKISLALVAPVVGLVALFLIARTSGNADAGQVKDPTTVATSAPTPTTPQAGFTNHWLS